LVDEPSVRGARRGGQAGASDGLFAAGKAPGCDLTMVERAWFIKASQEHRARW
jgi:hypothetical protein